MIRSALILLVAGGLLLPGGDAAAQSAATEKCSKTVGKETRKFQKGYQKALGKCLDTIARDVIGGAVVPGSKAGKTCVSSLRKIYNFEKPSKTLGGKLWSKVAKACGDTLDPDLSVSVLGSTCAAYDGDGAVDDLDEWLFCIDEAASCGARHALVSQYPRLTEWLALVRAEVLAVDKGCQPAGTCTECYDADDPKVIDACAALDYIESEIDGTVDDGIPEHNCGPGEPIRVEPTLPVTGQTADFGSGSDGNLQAGLAFAYVDNGDGTITDENTGLMWEKKDDGGGIHDKDNTYSWCVSSCPYADDGTIITDFLATLNAGDGFAGYTDWRLPNAKEALSIVDYGAPGSPVVDPLFHQADTCADCSDNSLESCSCSSINYWTSTTVLAGTSRAISTTYDVGYSRYAEKTEARAVRAVRDAR